MGCNVMRLANITQNKGNHLTFWFKESTLCIMDTVDLVGALLATAVACSPLVLLAYRRSDSFPHHRTFLESISNVLVSVAPLAILFVLHTVVMLGAILLAQAHWEYVAGNGQAPEWGLYPWMGIFLSLSHFVMNHPGVRQARAPVFPRTVFLLICLNFLFFVLPYILFPERDLLFHDYSRTTIPLLAILASASAYIQMITHQPRTEESSVDGVEQNDEGVLREEVESLRSQIGELTTSLDAQRALTEKMKQAHEQASGELAITRIREAKLTDSVDQYQLRLAETEVERNKISQELREETERGQELRHELEQMRKTYDTSILTAAQERMRLEQEMADVKAREKELLTTMEKLSLAVTLLRKRSGKATGHPGFGMPDKGTQAEVYYAHVLGMPGHMTPRGLKDRHRELVMQNHPDRVEAMDPAIREFAELRMKEVNEAYQFFKRKLGI
jgi:hypothetical protein